MSRRRGEFEHRTSIFEGAYRAWSHLGGLDPKELFSNPASELDPLLRPHTSDERVADANDEASYLVVDSSGKRRYYPYEPLPRSGLAHPFIQAIISPWLGPDAEQDDIQLGLTTLRTWWQHRRKGESHSAKQALGTEKIIPVVEGYTRHFFNLAHCGVVNDGDQPPRTLAIRIKQLEKEGYQFPDRPNGTTTSGSMQRKQGNESDSDRKSTSSDQVIEKSYGDPNRTPVVFVGENGSHQIIMNVSGITCYHCVRIIETVLNGIEGGDSPIRGLIDSVADKDLSVVLIRIQMSSMAKQIAYEAIETVKMLGYEGVIKEISIKDPVSGRYVGPDNLQVAFDVAAATDPKTIFDWGFKCTCSDNLFRKADCMRHSQMSEAILDAFNVRAVQIMEFITGSNVPVPQTPPQNKTSSQKRKVAVDHDSNFQHSNVQNQDGSNEHLQQEQTTSVFNTRNQESFSNNHSVAILPNKSSPNHNSLMLQSNIRGLTPSASGISNQPGAYIPQGDHNVQALRNQNLSAMSGQNGVNQQVSMDTNKFLSQYLMFPQHFLNQMNANHGGMIDSQNETNQHGASIQYTNRMQSNAGLNSENDEFDLSGIRSMNNQRNSSSMTTNQISNNSYLHALNSQFNEHTNLGLSNNHGMLLLNNNGMNLQMNVQNARNQGGYIQYPHLSNNGTSLPAIVNIHGIIPDNAQQGSSSNLHNSINGMNIVMNNNGGRNVSANSQYLNQMGRNFAARP